MTLENQSTDQQIMLAVLAHPDDESFGMGGTLALYAGRGVQVHLVCATRGEAGSMDEDCLDGFASVAERRVSELRCAAGILGLASVSFLDYRDSGMPGSPDNSHPQALAAAPLEEVARRVAHYIRLLRPQVVLTFDPIGGYKHPDHIAVHRATVEAFYLASDPAFSDECQPFEPQKLYFNVFPKGMLRLAVRLLPLFGRDPRKFGRNNDIDLAALAKEGDFPVHARIDYRSVEDKRDAAAACHESQLGSGPPRRGLYAWLARFVGRKEHFMRALPPPPPGLREEDLFEGVIYNEYHRGV
jgi:LmbE family N-acetylglucosaminyl deacetylase